MRERGTAQALPTKEGHFFEEALNGVSEMADRTVILEHKKWNTKKVYVGDFLAMTYRRCPKVIYFQSPMVNDANQSLCMGWGDMREWNRRIKEQLLGGLKPLGIMSFSVTLKEMYKGHKPMEDYVQAQGRGGQ